MAALRAGAAAAVAAAASAITVFAPNVRGRRFGPEFVHADDVNLGHDAFHDVLAAAYFLV